MPGYYNDETTEASRQLFDSVADTGALVPALWRLEVANSLTVAVRRGRIDAECRRAALDDPALLDITTDAHTDTHGRKPTPARRPFWYNSRSVNANSRVQVELSDS